MLIISDIKENLVLIAHSHNTFFIIRLYPLYLQFFSHKDKYLLLNTSILLFNIKVLLYFYQKKYCYFINIILNKKIIFSQSEFW